jgi:uncharacterized membrane protein (UPF0136 family)
MLNSIAGQAALAVYALLLAVGGIIGYTKAGSKPSLIAGLASAVAAIFALVLSFQNLPLGMGTAGLISAVLCAFFGRRYLVTTRKFMPAGLLAVVSLAVLIISVLVVVGR